ncbi:hypothetical protein [Microvirga arsenatis]|uniref:Uncharacterized protein n=1 Tax=Microvirga arsenatis TaxID=2692265 RepID=A0ABW9YVK3_9HYPH|nr:hypothetical protein [Microvirga arsenatis]NBJ13304.1 hypothetical protein [Microvirga arsenatis]NBJ24088.1 hypothetical protein [Microvirga arsenatis]
MTTAPILYQWNGEAMVPHPRFRAECDRSFVVGENYRLAIHEDRSLSSHNHEFAFVAEAWAQLPEHLTEQFRTPEHLRKRALIDAGYFNQQEVDAGSHAAALRVANFLASMDEYSVVVVRGPIVVVRKPKSQSRRAMGAREFQESKQAILEIISAMIGVQPETLNRNTGRAA